ncbi:MAG: PHP domain-containing protein [Chloroflexota bacterium]|nr:PHP domain-containing protein [Chloroflexota bacterium]
MTHEGRADLHIHSLASDGTASVVEILERAAGPAGLDVIAITDHERIDSAVAARELARDRGMPLEVIVGEEISTRGGHLLGLFLTERVRAWGSLQGTIAAIHAQGGLAIPAHPLFPYPLCAQAAVLRRLLADPDPAFHPDALEAFNPTTLGRGGRRVAEFIAAHDLAGIGCSDAHALGSIGQGYTTFPGRTADDLRAAIQARQTRWHGVAHPTGSQLAVFGRQLRKRGRDVRDEVGGRVRRDGTGRDHGYPGGRARPPRYAGGDGRPVEPEVET